MKQIGIIVLVGLLTMGFSSLAFTEENKDDMTDMISKNMKQVGEMFQGKTKGKGDLCDMMMGKSLVATADGGVVVWLGNKLFKYDKDLVLQKEVEIKCLKSGKMKSEGTFSGETKEEPKGQTMSPQSSEHESPHSH